MTTADSKPSDTKAPAPSAKGARLPEVPKPNIEDYQTKIAAERAAINSLFRDLNELSAKIKGIRSGQTSYGQRVEDARSNIDIVSKQIQDLENERAKLFVDIDEFQRSNRDMKTKVQALKHSLGFQTEDEIDAKIREVERYIATNRMTVPEENRYIAQIQQLKSRKPLVGKYADMESDASNQSQTSLVPLKVRSDEIREELRVLLQKKRDYGSQLREISQEHGKATSPLRDLYDQRDSLSQRLAQHRKRENELREELEAKSAEYHAYVTKIQRAREELIREDMKRKQAEVAREKLQQQLEDVEDEERSPEHQLTIQVIFYVKKLMERAGLGDSQTPTDVESSKSNDEASLTVDGNPEFIVMRPKNERDDDYYIAPTAAKKAGKKKNKKSAAIKHVLPIAHDILVLSDFERLGVPAPLVLADCANALRLLEEKAEKLKQEHAKQQQFLAKKREALRAKVEALTRDAELAGAISMASTADIPLATVNSGSPVCTA